MRYFEIFCHYHHCIETFCSGVAPDYSINLQTVIIPESVSVIEQYAFLTCENLTINCEAKGKPDGWNVNWNHANCPVVWGYVD